MSDSNETQSNPSQILRPITPQEIEWVNQGIRGLDESETVTGDEWIDIRSGLRFTKGSVVDRGFFPHRSLLLWCIANAAVDLPVVEVSISKRASSPPSLMFCLSGMTKPSEASMVRPF